jgi:hypothetical protein
MSAFPAPREYKPTKVTVDMKITSRECIPGCSPSFFPRPTCGAHHIAAFRTGDPRSAEIRPNGVEWSGVARSKRMDMARVGSDSVGLQKWALTDTSKFSRMENFVFALIIKDCIARS